MESSLLKQNLEKQAVISRLQACGINPTQQRVVIAQLLFSRPQHLSAEQVLELVNQGKRKVSKATVYNTLNLFAGSGLLREVVVDPAKLFYDSNTSDHHHLYHVDTGVLADIPVDQLHITHLPTLPEGTVAIGVDVIVRVRSSDPSMS